MEMKGGMTGEIKIEESLYLKGSAPSDGRDGALSFESQQKSAHEIKLFDAHQQEAPNFQTRFTFKIFPYWELSVPLLGTDSEHKLGTPIYPTEHRVESRT